MINQQTQARELYFGSGKTQKEIAQAVGVHEKTIYRWIKQEAWDQLKRATLAMPVIIIDNMCNQLLELQNGIKEREEGNRFPTMQEAEITRKLINSITKMKDYPSMGLNIQMMTSFSNYIGFTDLDFNKKLVTYADSYFKGKTKYGYDPYNFGGDTQSPKISPEEINALKEEIENQERETMQAQKSATVKEDKKNPIEEPVTLNGIEKSVTLSGVEGRHDSTKADKPQEQLPTKSCELKINSQPDIPNPHPTETQSYKATQPTNPQNSPCPPPDKTGHQPTISQLKNNNTSSPSERPGEVPMPYGITWLGGNQVFDRSINRKREIKNGEADWLRRNGYIKR
jgi:DNA-binding XRE family transcriptional regulator